MNRKHRWNGMNTLEEMLSEMEVNGGSWVDAYLTIHEEWNNKYGIEGRKDAEEVDKKVSKVIWDNFSKPFLEKAKVEEARKLAREELNREVREKGLCRYCKGEGGDAKWGMCRRCNGTGKKKVNQ